MNEVANTLDNSPIHYVIAEDGGRWFLAKDALRALGLETRHAPLGSYLRGLTSEDWTRITPEDAQEAWGTPFSTHAHVISQRGLGALQWRYAGRKLEMIAERASA